jgi:hypothetical protein
MSELLITATEFEERLAALCQGVAGSAFPRRHRDRHILYRSIVQTLDVTKNYPERMLNVALQRWLSEVGAGIDIDHVTLRRYLVDEAYLFRDAKGSTYAVNLTGRGDIEFEQAVAAIDSSAVIQAAKSRVAARKRQHSGRGES